MAEWTWYKLFENIESAFERVPLNQTMLLKAGELEICLGHTAKGLFAVANECSHLRASLHKGNLNELNEIVCPWHHYRFSLETGEETSQHNCPKLQTYPIDIRKDGIFIRLPF